MFCQSLTFLSLFFVVVVVVVVVVDCCVIVIVFVIVEIVLFGAEVSKRSSLCL